MLIWIIHFSVLPPINTKKTTLTDKELTKLQECLPQYELRSFKRIKAIKLHNCCVCSIWILKMCNLTLELDQCYRVDTLPIEIYLLFLSWLEAKSKVLTFFLFEFNFIYWIQTTNLLWTKLQFFSIYSYYGFSDFVLHNLTKNKTLLELKNIIYSMYVIRYIHHCSIDYAIIYKLQMSSSGRQLYNSH